MSGAGEGGRRAGSSRVTRHIDAARGAVYRAFLDASAVSRWMVPPGMTSRIHAFDGREGGRFRASLTYDEPTAAGKTTAHTDTYHGRFVELVPDRKIVEIVEFETSDPSLRGEMTVTVTLEDGAGGGTEVVAGHDGLPPGLSPADNGTGWRLSLDQLASMLEAEAAT